jgi:enoyl-CoA hydratase/carnithine racemase
MTDVLRDDRDGIAILTLNRPDVLNALRPALWVELSDHLETIARQTDEVGCVVLRGAGRSFSAGNDLKAVMAGERAPSPDYQAEVIDRIEALPQPVIASVHGHCLTGALELVLGCTMLVVAETSRIADTHGQWAMSPTWGMSQRLPRRIGPLLALELMCTGRELDGIEAAAVGLANRCVPDDALEAETMALARRCAERTWHTLRSVKRLVREGQDLTLSEALAHERTTSRPGPDMAARLEAFGSR